MALVAHHAAHAEPGLARPIGQSTRVLGRTPAAGEAHVDVDEHLGDPGPRRGVDRRLGVDGHGDASTRAGQMRRADWRRRPRWPTAGRRPGRRPAMPSISLMVAQVNRCCPSVGLVPGQRGALVRLDVRPQPVARQGLRHGAQVVLEGGRLDDQRRRRQLGRSSCGRRLARTSRQPRIARGSGTLRASEHAVVWRCLRPGRCVPGRGAVAARGARRLHRRHCEARRSTRSASPTSIGRGRRRPRPTSPLPFGGVPFGIKELEKVAGWPYTEASVIFRDRVAGHDDTSASRLRTHGRRARRADDGAGVRRHQLHLDRAARDDAQPVEPGAARRAARRAERRPRWPVAFCRSPPGATAAGPSEGRQGSAACSG